MRLPSFVMSDKSIIRPIKGHSAYGKVFDTEFEVKCRIEPHCKLVIDKDGNQYSSNAKGFFPHSLSILPESEIEHNGVTYEVISAIPMKGLRSISHVEVLMR